MERIEIDLDRRHVAGDASVVRERGADRDDAITLVHEPACHRSSGAAEHATAEWMAVRDQAFGFEGGENGDNHPIAWNREFDGGRMFYTGLGHTDEAWQDGMFLSHVWGGISYAMHIE